MLNKQNNNEKQEGRVAHAGRDEPTRALLRPAGATGPPITLTPSSSSPSVLLPSLPLTLPLLPPLPLPSSSPLTSPPLTLPLPPLTLQSHYSSSSSSFSSSPHHPSPSTSPAPLPPPFPHLALFLRFPLLCPVPSLPRFHPPPPPALSSQYYLLHLLSPLALDVIIGGEAAAS